MQVRSSGGIGGLPLAAALVLGLAACGSESESEGDPPAGGGGGAPDATTPVGGGGVPDAANPGGAGGDTPDAATPGGAGGGGGESPDAGPSCTAPPAPAPQAEAFANPQSVLFAGDRLVVSNTHLDPVTYSPLEGYVTVVDPATGEVKNRVATRQPNPQKLALYGEQVVVLSTGPITYDFETGDSTSGGPGGLDLLDTSTLDDAAQASAHIALAPSAEDAHLGAPVDLVVYGERAYVTSATSNALFVVDLALKALERGPENPLLYGGDGSEVRLTTGSITRGTNRLYIADFNGDAVHVVDPATNTVSPCAVDVGLSPMDLEGATAPRVEGEHLYVLLALAQAVRRVSLADLERAATAAAGACPEVPVETFTATTGMIPNDLVFGGGALHIVSSGDNAVYRYDARGEPTKTYVLMPGSNPWSAAVSADGRHLAVTEWVSGAVSLIDTACDDHLLRVTAQ